MSFKKNKYIVVKEALNPKIADFIYKYFLLKRKVTKTMFESNYISKLNFDHGTWGDKQVPNTFSCYADIVMETLLSEMLPVMEKNTGLKLYETNSFARIYKKGDILKKHKDRFSCEISTTLNLGGDSWPIFLEPNVKKGMIDKVGDYIASDSKGIEINLKPGDMLIYSGCELEHWRNEFKGENCAQVFLHYNNQKTKEAEKNKFDKRPHLGLPPWFCRKK
jgi:hypothetical protein